MNAQMNEWPSYTEPQKMGIIWMAILPRKLMGSTFVKHLLCAKCYAGSLFNSYSYSVG